MAAVATMGPTSLQTEPWSDTLSTRIPEVPVSTDGDSIEQHDESYNSDILPFKMTQVLYNEGYDRDARAKVYERSQSNMIRISSPTSISGKGRAPFGTMTEQDLKDVVEGMILGERGMLDASMLKERNLHLNSNEPVLLLELGEIDYRTIEDVQLIKNEALRVLRDSGIRPVRVYTRCGELESDENQLSLTLLNVVNTDIGGPSMIQLLDAAFHEGWTNDLVSKEAWNGTDLLWRDESYVRTVPNPTDWSNSQPFNPEVTASEEATETQDTETEVASSLENAPEEPIVVHAEEQPPTHAAGEEVDSKVEIQPVEHPAMKALLENEAQRPGIQHPTWTHQGHSDSLADLIRSQSLTTPDNVTREDEELDSHEDPQVSQKESRTSSEDSFVVL